MTSHAGVRFPALPRRGLGVGLDLRWGDAAGFDVDDAGRDRVAPALGAFLAREGPGFAHAFFSWQPRDRGRLQLEDYAPAWDTLAAAVPAGLPLGLHHTALNLAAMEPAPRGALLDFTNALCARYGLGWINEDVGFWSVGGRPVPYPQPPVLDGAGLAACVRNTRECQRALAVPLVLEFPGFADDVCVVQGKLDAYDFFRALAEETCAPVTLDVAHLLSWRWWRGLRGEALYGDLDRLPLAHAFEIHMSGCELVGEGPAARFVDAHHGRLLDEQLTLLERLLPLCPNLRAVTFEDPRLDAAGALDAGSRASLARLRAAVDGWTGAAPEPVAASRAAPVAVSGGDTPSDGRALEATIAERLGSAMVGLVRARIHRGTGRLADAFPRCVAGWRAAHPEDRALEALFARFVSSSSAAAWREHPGLVGGACLEACFADFANQEGLATSLVVEEELLSVLLRALTVTPDPAFDPPPFVRRAPRGWFAVSRAEPPVLHAALAGRYVRGTVTADIAAILEGTGQRDDAAPVRARLVELGLLPTTPS